MPCPPRLSRRPAAAVLAVLPALLALLGAGAASASAAVPAAPARAAVRSAPRADVTAGLHVIGRTSQYTDPYSNVHLLTYVGNSGPTVEQPGLVIDLLDASGTRTVSQVSSFFPVGWLKGGEDVGVDYTIDRGVLADGSHFSGRWRVDHFEGQVPQADPDHNFKLEDISGPTSPSDTAVLHGKAVNLNSFPVVLIKVTCSFLDSQGNVLFIEPTDVNSDDRIIPPGGEYPFQLPREAGVPAFDPDVHDLIVEGNEPGTPNPGPTTGALGPTTSAPRPTHPAVVLDTTSHEHSPAADAAPAGVPNPSASDVAGFEHPGTVVRRHDARGFTGDGPPGPQALIDNGSTPAPRSTAFYAPLLLIALLGGYGLVATLRSARSGVAGLAAWRRRRRATAGAVPPGGVGGYGAMPGSTR